MIELIQIAAFIKRNCKHIKQGGFGRRKRENLLMWLAWHTARYNACTIKDDNNKIVGVGIARRIKKIEDANIPYKSDEEGDILFVEQVACKSNEAFKTLLYYVSKRWHGCKKIMFRKQKNSMKNKIYDFQLFLKKAKI